MVGSGLESKANMLDICTIYSILPKPSDFLTPMLFVIGDISLEKSQCLSLQMRSVLKFHP